MKDRGARAVEDAAVELEMRRDDRGPEDVELDAVNDALSREPRQQRDREQPSDLGRARARCDAIADNSHKRMNSIAPAQDEDWSELSNSLDIGGNDADFFFH